MSVAPPRLTHPHGSFCRSTIGEHVLGTVLMLTHKLNYLNYTMHAEQRWVPHKELGGQFIRDLPTMSVGIIGYGHIGASTEDSHLTLFSG